MSTQQIFTHDGLILRVPTFNLQQELGRVQCTKTPVIIVDLPEAQLNEYQRKRRNYYAKLTQ